MPTRIIHFNMIPRTPLALFSFRATQMVSGGDRRSTKNVRYKECFERGTKQAVISQMKQVCRDGLIKLEKHK